LSLCCWNTRILGITAVEVSPQTAHGCGDDIAGLEFFAGRFFDDPDSLNAEYAWEGDPGRVALASEELGTVEAEGFDSNEDLTDLGFGS
jgi:hypothetical protein